MRTLVWFRGKDLRVSDHEPLARAAADGEVVCLFVVDPFFFAPERAREIPHRMQFLLESLELLEVSLRSLGAPLLLVGGKSVSVVPRVARQYRADRVLAHRWTEPFGRERDRRVAAALDVPFIVCEGERLLAPGSVRTAEGRAFSVYSPFAAAARRALAVRAPMAAPARLRGAPTLDVPGTVALPRLQSLGVTRNDRLLPGGETAARGRLDLFLAGSADRYHEQRDRLDLDGTSRLSADLKFGTLSVRTVWAAAHDALAKAAPKAWERFSGELLWREFAHDVLWHTPELLKSPRRREFEEFPWEKDDVGFHAWAEGKTGYPVVDAAARELLATGFVHNRARMVAASFLTKHLRIDYRRGEAHYLRYLTDGDWAQNNAGWQWSAGCGFDAQPYFRVFNPMEQGRKFDPSGGYVRKWVPELAGLPTCWLHEPWRAPPLELAAAGVTLGASYPAPIVDHGEARTRYLALASALMANRREGNSAQP